MLDESKVSEPEVSAPKPITNTADIFIIGEMRPSFTFDTIIATTIATMNAAVPTKGPCTGSLSEWPKREPRKKISNGPKSSAKLSKPEGFFVVGSDVIACRR